MGGLEGVLGCFKVVDALVCRDDARRAACVGSLNRSGRDRSLDVLASSPNILDM